MQKLTVLMLFVAVLLFTCKKPPAVQPGGKQPTDTTKTFTVDTTTVIAPIDPSVAAGYNTGLTQWQTFKGSSTNGYVFVIDMMFVELPYSNTQTTTTVVDNKIVKREYLAYKYTDAGKITVAHWTEDKDHINSHPGITWLLTLDDVYYLAKTKWLNVDAATYFMYLETKNHGLISKVGSQFKTCVDNCFIGVNISSITAL